MTTNPYIGSSLDDLLKEDGVLEEVEAIVIKRVLAWQVQELMQAVKFVGCVSEA
jgi:hypothetical protein